DVERIVALERLRIGAAQKLGEWIRNALVRYVHRLHVGRGHGHTRAIDIIRKERLARDQHRVERSPARGGAETSYDDVPPWLRFAEVKERVDGQRDQPQRFARRLQSPAA